jgi:hypothetical protein
MIPPERIGERAEGVSLVAGIGSRRPWASLEGDASAGALGGLLQHERELADIGDVRGRWHRDLASTGWSRPGTRLAALFQRLTAGRSERWLHWQGIAHPKGHRRDPASPADAAPILQQPAPAADPAGATPALAAAAAADPNLWTTATTPATVTVNDAHAVELGVKFTASSSGTITGIRFYKGPQNTGTHVGSLWTTTGTLLATGTFTGETASGWQDMTFSSPVTINANTTYIASYHTNTGFYSANSNYFASTYSNAPLTAPSSSSSGGNGVFIYSATSAFPTRNFNATNYWVDVDFLPSTSGTNSPPVANNDTGTTVAGLVTAPGAVLNIAKTRLLANDSDPDGNPLTVTGVSNPTNGAVAISGNNVVFTPASGYSGPASFRYTISDGQGATASAQVSLTVTSNAIALENAKAGTPQSTWDVPGAGNSNIQGFATNISVNHGSTVNFKIKTTSTNYRIEIYRLGYYQGKGARLVTTIQKQLTTAQVQPAPLTDASTGLVDAGNWAVSASWAVPSTAVSGVYIAKLVRQDSTFGASLIPFIVRDDSSHSDLVFQTDDTTWQAYNDWGGNSLYLGTFAGSDNGRAFAVSYNRPIVTRGATRIAGPQDFVFDEEYPMIRWLEANGYDVSYISGIDTDRNGSLLLNHKTFLSVGHDEYWSGQQRANVQAARDAGVNLAFFSGNEMFWKTRYLPSLDASQTAYRTLVTYKETRADAKIDPSSTWTGTWRDSRFSPPSDGGTPENALTGTLFQVDGTRFDTITVPQVDGRNRFWRNTSIANLAPGQSATLTANVLGYEWDVDADNGFRPAGQIHLSTTTKSISTQYLLDYGKVDGSGTATHSLVEYRAPSGALVFGAGTTRWSWGLDSHHDNQASTVDPRMQQATINLLADMGAQPSTIQPGMVGASASTDLTAPTAKITSPASGAAQEWKTVTVTGTAADTGGGVVAGVEVSTDGGATWHPASGHESWSYSFVPAKTGTYGVLSRATDDSLNTGAASTAVTLTVGPATNLQTIWGDSAVPTIVKTNDPRAAEVGLKFRSDVAGTIVGVRFYKGPTNVGPHIADLWTTSGTLLASARFTSETASGWQQVNFTNPVPISADTTYIVAYHTNAYYSSDSGYFKTAKTSGHLTALADGTDGGNGLITYGAADAPPTTSTNQTNYWVDVVFQPQATAPAVVAKAPPAKGHVANI